MGEGNKKLSKRDPQAHMQLYRDQGFLPEGLLNYLALLGWAIAADRDVFSLEEMVAAFDIGDVNPNPARFDLKKAEAINAAQMRLLSTDEITHRVLPFLKAAGVVGDPVHDADAQLLELAMPLVAERINKLTEAVPMLDWLFVDEADFTRDEADVAKLLDDDGRDVVRASYDALEGLDGAGRPPRSRTALQAALVDELGLKPRNAYGPVRVAVTGRRVSPPLFESLELLGRERGLGRLRAARPSRGLTRRGRGRHDRDRAVARRARRAAGAAALPPAAARRAARRVAPDRRAPSSLVAAMVVLVPLFWQLPFALWFLVRGEPVVAGMEPAARPRRPDAGGAGLPQPHAGLGDPGHLAAGPDAARRPAAVAGLGRRRGSAGAGSRPAWGSRCSRCCATLVVSSLLPAVEQGTSMSGSLNELHPDAARLPARRAAAHPAAGGGGGVRLPRLPHPGLRRPLPPPGAGGARARRCSSRWRTARRARRSSSTGSPSASWRGRAGDPHRRARGRHRDARAEQLAGLRGGAGVRRHGLDAEPHRRQLVEPAGHADPVAGLPRRWCCSWPGDGASSRRPRTGPFWSPPGVACKVSPGSEGRSPPRRGWTSGIWCNWQHDWFWSSYSRFES